LLRLKHIPFRWLLQLAKVGCLLESPRAYPLRNSLKIKPNHCPWLVLAELRRLGLQANRAADDITGLFRELAVVQLGDRLDE